MKIITLSYSDIIGGAFRAAYRIHQSLLEADVQSIFFAESPTSGDPSVYSTTGGLANFVKYCRVRIGRLPTKYLLKPKNGTLRSFALLRSRWPNRINNANADIINLHWINYEMLSIEDIGRIKKPIVWTLHDMWAFCGSEHYTNSRRYINRYLPSTRPLLEHGFDIDRWVWKRKLDSWKQPMHIVTPSVWLADCVKQSAIMRDWPVTVIPNALNTTTWQPIDKNTARKILRLPDDCSILVFGAMGGGQDQRKGADLLFSALKDIQSTRSNIQLLVFGERRPLKTPGLLLPIHYLGHLYDDLSLRIVYSAADAMIVPSRMDNLPTTATEALACGTPVIAFNTCGLPDIVSHKKNGWLAEAFDSEDLASGIQWILNDEDRKRELSKQARSLAVARYAYPVVAKAYKDLYHQILDSI